MSPAQSSAADRRDELLGPDEVALVEQDLSGALEQAPLRAWRGLVLGLALSAVAWALLVAVGFALYKILGQ